jgi:hypothetical protein
MKTSKILGLALVGLGIYYVVKAYSKKSQPLASAKASEPKANATGFEVPKSGNKVFTQYGLL